MVEKTLKRIDWLLVFFIVPITLAGLITMKSFAPLEGAGNFFNKQIIWILLSFAVFFIFSFIDFRFLKRTDVLISLFIFFCGVLLLLSVLGHVSNGAKSWFNLGFLSFQPADMMNLVLVFLLAKYFSRRHVEIRDIRHIFISGFYALVPFVLVMLQPDFGSAMIIFFIWFGMALVSGISKKHLFFIIISGVLAFSMLWMFVFAPYQKARIKNFLNPSFNVHGSGYNTIQATIAVGSGQIIGKGLGFGTQSRLKFLPEYQTDFIFAAFCEEWGFVGAILICLLLGLVIWRILYFASMGASNFEILSSLGFAIFLMSHIFVNIGMNLGILPVAGIPLPFMSYGGSHLLTEFMGLGILMSMRRSSRSVHRDDIKNEFLGM